jgi:MOSC domain-containing protein YiiM
VAHIVSVNVGRPRRIASVRGRPLLSAIGKAPVEGRVRVEGVNLAGDDQADRSVHGGPDKAVYAYAREDGDWWADVLGIEIPNGMFGENLTVSGLDVSGAVIGARWLVGTAELEVSQPRLPCAKLGVRFGTPKMIRAFAQAGRPGAYLRIITPGELGAGDEVTVLSRPVHGVTVALVARAVMIDRSLAGEALAAPELAGQMAEFLA